MELFFEEEKETKNTIRFEEVVETGEPKIGTIYIKKSTLRDLGYQNGNIVKINLEIE